MQERQKQLLQLFLTFVQMPSTCAVCTHTRKKMKEKTYKKIRKRDKQTEFKTCLKYLQKTK